MVPNKTSQGKIPEGFRVIPISENDRGAALRLCVLVREISDPIAGQLVLLRDLPDARVYLGCLVDVGPRMHEWVEIWIQDVDGLDGSLPANRDLFSNHVLDERWVQLAKTFEGLNPDGFIQTGYESVHPAPAFLDLRQGSPVHPVSDTDGGKWNLCRDDRALTAAELPAYSTSLFRYLAQENGTSFIPVVKGAPTNGTTKDLEQTAGLDASFLPFNPQGGLMMVLPFYPLSFEEFNDLLGGKPWRGIEHGKKVITFDGVYSKLGDPNEFQQSCAYLFLGSHGRAGRLLESFHLKLQLQLEMFTLVRKFVEEHQRPFLNLAPDSFRVRLQEIGSGLPFLWTARCMLAKSGNAFALPVESSEFQYFTRAGNQGESIYLPQGLTGATQGNGSVRIRKILPSDQGRIVVEGTLIMHENITPSPHDLLWIRLPMPSGRVDLYGHLYASEGLAEGEARFRTVPQSFAPNVVAALTQGEGVSFAKAPFEVVPLLSSPCDLYSLGVMAVRTFLVGRDTTLAVSLDEMLSFARQLAVEYKSDIPRKERVRALFEKDHRYEASLGPNRLLTEDLSVQDAFRLLPPDIWHELLGTIASLFPGLGPDSVCRDNGDVATLALETVFTRPIDEITRLVEQSRSLIVIDWNYNREVHAAIQQQLARYASEK